jgi:NADH-quinone oxidoreductase subunit H
LQPIGFLLFAIGGFAETNRAPFDLPEAEQELTGGYHTEYAGMRFALYYMAEYVNMVTISALVATFFLGGWTGIGTGIILTVSQAPWYQLIGFGWFMVKVGFFIFLYIWVRATLPRLRYDQLMTFGWKILLPLSVANMLVTALYVSLS